MARSFALVAVVVALLVAFSCSAVASARILTEEVAANYSQQKVKHGLPSFALPPKPSHPKPTLPTLPSLPSCSPPPASPPPNSPSPVNYTTPPPPAGGY